MVVSLYSSSISFDSCCNSSDKAVADEFVNIALETYLNNEEPNTPWPDSAMMFQSIKPFLNKIDNIQCLEQALWSILGVAGRCDIIANYNGTPSIIDFENYNGK